MSQRLYLLIVVALFEGIVGWMLYGGMMAFAIVVTLVTGFAIGAYGSIGWRRG